VIAVLVFAARTSGWNLESKPARRADNRIYVTRPMEGMYKSGELTSSLGGAYFTTGAA
jgi:hypothetical protein